MIIPDFGLEKQPLFASTGLARQHVNQFRELIAGDDRDVSGSSTTMPCAPTAGTGSARSTARSEATGMVARSTPCSSTLTSMRFGRPCEPQRTTRPIPRRPSPAASKDTAGPIARAFAENSPSKARLHPHRSSHPAGFWSRIVGNGLQGKWDAVCAGCSLLAGRIGRTIDRCGSSNNSTLDDEGWYMGICHGSIYCRPGMFGCRHVFRHPLHRGRQSSSSARGRGPR